MGEVEKEGSVLVVRRIDVTYTLAGASDVQRSVVERVHDLHRDRCPVARSIAGSIEITTSLNYR